MRNFIAILICLSSALALYAKDLIFTDGDFTYVASTKTFYNFASLRSFNGSTSYVVVPETVTYDSRTLYIRRIGSDVFKGNTNIESVKINAQLYTIDGIGLEAFKNCTNLRQIFLPQNISDISGFCFQGCINLVDVTFPQELSRIWGGAFSGCEKLSKVALPDSVAEIGSAAFSKCINLKTITIPTKVKELHSQVFSGCTSLSSIVLHDDIVSICEYAFEDCSSLSNIELPQGLTRLEGRCFKGCSSLEKITIPSNVSSYSESGYHFAGCSNLIEAVIKSAYPLPWAMFADCISLTRVKMPATINSICGNTFQYCSLLRDIVFDGDNPNYRIQNNFLLDKTGETLILSLQGTDVPESVKSIQDHAFSGRGMEALDLPYGITNIGYGAFSRCRNLRTIIIPEGVANIAGEVFSDCNSLRSATISKSVTSIQALAFAGCTNLKFIKFEGKPPAADSNSFSGITDATGYYTSENAAIWREVIGNNGYWHGLKMKMEGAPDSYNVIFDKNGGDSVSTESLTRDDGAVIGELPTATREGYDFAGWFTDAEGGTEISGSTVVTGNVTYYAHWTQRKPVTYTIRYEANNGSGFVTNVTVVAGTEYMIEDIESLVISWEGHYFSSWAFLGPGETEEECCQPGQIFTVNGDIVCRCEWRPVMLAPLSADWQKGELTLMYGSMEAGMGVSVECRRGDDPSAIWNDIGKEVELSPVVDGHVTITDRNFSSRYDGIPPVEYRVKDTAGGEATCTTRVKYALAVAVSNFQDNWLKGHAYMTSYATKFATLAQEGGAKLIALLRDEDATLVKINEAFASLANMVQTGDVCLFYFGTHGGVYPGTTDTGLWLYQKDIYYSEENLANHIDSLAADWGVATVGIVHACHSGGLADNSNDTYCKGGWCVNSMLTSPNAAWITSTDSADVSAYGDHFSEFLIGYGWEKGWAGSEGKALTFGSLADYMGRTYDELFSGVLVGDNPKVIKAGITNKPLLDRIAIGRCAHHEAKPKPAAFSITPSTDDPNKVSLKTSEVSADKLSVFSRFVRTGRWTLWTPYDGGNQPALYRLDQDTTKKGEAANTRHSSENDKMEFIVKAYNGAGVTAAYNNPVQGWRAAMTAQTEDGRTWNYGKVEGGVSIVSAAESSASGYGDALKGDVAIPSTLNGMSIVSISSHAFEGCEEITSVTIPDSVTSIGDRAFYGCTGLTSVTISDSVTNIGEHVFAECDQLQSLVFPPSVKSIGYGAVSYCESLDRIALSENLESIGDFAFYGNPALTAVYIPSSVKEIGMGAFAYCDSLASIDVADGNAEYASANGMLFTKDKKTLLFVPGGMREEMLVPSGVELIGASAAEGCFNLEIASLPASVIEIGEFAFAYCSKLPRLRIPDQVRAIGDAAFLQCGAMKDIALPASLTTLGDGVFAGCTNIVSLTVAESNTNFMVLDDILYGQDLSTLYYALNSVRKVHVPEGVKLIASDAFVFCKELQDVVLPSSLNRIASEAFGDCDALGSIRIPKEVSEIGEYAFYECENLTNVCFEGNAPSVGDHAFDEIAPTCVVHVRRDSTGWGVDIPGTWNGLRIEYFNDAPKLVGTGKVTVPKSWKTGQEVTWKATADKGSVFARWEGPLVDSLNLTVNERRNPSLAFAVPEGFAANQVTAVFIHEDDDGFSSLGITQTEFSPNATLSDVYVTDDSQSYVTASVKGLPSGLKFNAKTLKISGKAMTPGVYKVTVSATNATVKKPVTAEFEIVVPNLASEVLPGLEPETDAYGVVMCGVAIDPGLVNCKPKDGWTVKVAGLPAGLKFTAKDIMKKGSKTEVEIPANTIYGVPTKAGTYTVTFTATKGKEKQTATITLKTEALPDWAAGTFTGYVKENGGSTVFGPATMTVAASGKISGKFTMEGTNWTFSAASYAAVDGEGFLVDAVAKAGKATMPVEMRLYGSTSPETDGKPLVNASAEGGFGGSDDTYIYLWRNMWKDKATSAETKAVLAGWEGVYTLSMEDGGYASLTVGKNGDVKIAGKLADGTALSATSPFMYDICKDFFTVFTLLPSAYKGGFVYLPVGFGTERGRLDDLGGDLVWSSRNPQATGAYGEGFERWTSFTGAYYDKTKKLSDHYNSLRFSAEQPTLNDVEPQNDGEVEITIDAKGKPVIDKASGLTLSFTQATGIFKGGYTFVFDAKTKKKVSFEGILVQGEEPKMNGFYLWDAASSYADPKNGKTKTYKYKESHPVTLTP